MQRRNRSAPFLMNDDNTEAFAWYGQAVAISQFLEDALVATLASLQPRTQLASSSPHKLRKDLTRANLGAIQHEMEKYAEFRDAGYRCASTPELTRAAGSLVKSNPRPTNGKQPEMPCRSLRDHLPPEHEVARVSLGSILVTWQGSGATRSLSGR
jgi:hypothetical protein